MHWDTQMSGIRIPDQVASELERVWRRFTADDSFSLPEEVEASATYVEGAVRQITVDAYERNPDARRECISHYGARCSICGFDFEAVYGTIGRGFIHVHHLRQLSDMREMHEVDPIRDLRPVCPNCHAMLHRRNPPYSVEELQTFIQESGS
ncbi:MAG: HNH endonuclease [Anaerolineae bacterium]|nr:HNH endonuclease [Anaerolineae bacterium]